MTICSWYIFQIFASAEKSPMTIFTFKGTLQTGEAKVPQPFNNFEDHSHELGGPPLPTKTTQKPSQKGRKNKAKDNEVREKDQLN